MGGINPLFCGGVFALFLLLTTPTHAQPPPRSSVTNIFTENRDSSDRLIVTPYITRGEIERVQNLSRVTNFTRVHSYSGFFNVHPTYNSNMFFWFFPAAVSQNWSKFWSKFTNFKEFWSKLWKFWQFLPFLFQYNSENAPVVLWLQGGPGAPSLFGLFTEHGPFLVDSKSYLRFRSNPWSLTHSVLYIDNPVGCGMPNYCKLCAKTLQIICAN